MRKLLALIILIGLSAFSAQAADIYFAQTSAGSNNGTNCANAYSMTRFNTNDSNWSGDNTLHLCGTITTAGVLQASGTSGHLITVKFETNAKFSAATWANGSNILGASAWDYGVIDGGTNGIIEATNNGSSPTYANQNDFFGVHIATCNHCEIKNLLVRNLFIRNGTLDNQVGGNGIEITVGSNNHIHGNITHDMASGIGHNFGGTLDDIEIDHNVAYNHNWSYYGGHNGTSSVTNYKFHDNEAYDWYMWDDESTNCCHHNGLHLFSNAAMVQEIIAPQFYNNYFHGRMGLRATAFFFFDVESPGITDGLFFNNVIYDTDTGSDGPQNGQVVAAAGKISYYNNTFWSANVYNTCLKTDYTGTTPFSNNILRACNSAVWLHGNGTITGDKNTYYISAGWNIGPTYSPYNYAGWVGACSCDAASQNGVDPLLDASFVPLVTSPVIGFGTNFTSLMITALDEDATGDARPAMGAWDAGAKNYGATPTNPDISIDPISLSFGNVLLGVPSATKIFTATNTGNSDLHITTTVSSSARFVISSNTCASATIAMGDDCSLSVTYTPTVAGDSSATVTITSDAPSSPDVLGVFGTGLAQPAAVNPLMVGLVAQ